MVSKEFVDKKTEEIKKELLSIERPGMKELVEYMERKGFFTAPASTRFHGCFRGGLLIHSYFLYIQFMKHCQSYKLEFPKESMLICAFGHDLCKAGAYIEAGPGRYKWNNYNGKGHATLSLDRLKKFIELKPEEEAIIKYHMGMYGTTEFGGARGEYSIKELVDAYNNVKLAKLFYFCDDMSTQFLEKE